MERLGVLAAERRRACHEGRGELMTLERQWDVERIAAEAAPYEKLARRTAARLLRD
jgi:hypothetical protein